MISLPWWQMILAMIVAQVIWDFIKALWMSYRHVMNRDYGGGWFPPKHEYK